MEAPCILAFAGHMIDEPDRSCPRFPPEAADAVRSAIRRRILSLSPVAAVSSAACGGDIIFAEEILRQGIPLYVILPFQDKEEFISRSVSFAGPQWLERFNQVCRQASDPPLFVKPGGYRSDRDFEDCQRAVLFFGLGYAKAKEMQFVALLLCDYEQLGDAIGGTRSFLELCEQRNLLYEEISMAKILDSLQRDREMPEGGDKW
jgi:hypothetical protein